MTSRDQDSDQTAALLRDRRPGAARERYELDARLHLGEMRARFAGANPEPVTFRKWTVLRKLGQGGMGTVYLANNPALGRRVALKLVGDADVSSARDAAREARALASINHEHVVQVYSVDDASPPTVAIEMEFVEGETLRTWAAKADRSWREVVAVLADIGEGVEALHRAGIVHRDIKPENILISTAGRGKLADFGLAVAANRAVPSTEAETKGKEPGDGLTPLDLRMTATGALLGTLGYIAPEVMAGADATPRSDLFALASVLFEALCGALPFQGDSPAKLAQAIKEGHLSAPKESSKLPSWLQRELRRALSATPSARHPSVDSFVKVLRRGLGRRRRFWGAGALIAAPLTLLPLGWYLGPEAPDPCASAGAPMAELITPSEFVSQLGTDAPPPGAALLEETLKSQRDAWIEADIRLCATSRRRPLLDLQALERNLRRRQCLDESLTTLATLLEGTEAATAQRSAELLAAIEALPTCDDVFLAHWRPSVDSDARAKLDAALHHELAGEGDEASRLARAIADGHYPAHQRAEALYRLGHIFGEERRMEEATTALDEARELAFASGHDDLYCRAAAYQAKLAANVALSPEASRRDLRAATACLERTGARSPILRGDLLEARGLLSHAAGEIEDAVDFHRQALALRRDRLGDRHPDVARSLHNLGTALAERGAEGDRDAAEANYQEAVALWRAEVGADAPPLADTLVDLGLLRARAGNAEAAQDSLAEALRIYERSEGRHRASLAKVQTALALVALQGRDLDSATTHLAAAREHHKLADLPRDHVDRLIRLEAEGKLAALQRDFVTAEAAFAEALGIRRTKATEDELDVLIEWIEAAYALGKTPEIVTRVLAAGPALVERLRAEEDSARAAALAWYAGAALQQAGRVEEAVSFLQVAIAAYEALPDPPHAQLAELRWEVAQALAATSPTDALSFARAARDAYSDLGDHIALATISKWIRKNAAPLPPPPSTTTQGTR